MKRPLLMSAWVLAGLVVMAGLLFLLARALDDCDTLYQGQSLDHWREQATNSDATISREALTLLTGVVIPALTNQMFSDTNDSGFRITLIEKLEELPGVRVDFTASDGRRIQAVSELAGLGPLARSAIPALLEALRVRDPVLLAAAAQALPRVEADAVVAVPALLLCLTDAQGNGNPDVVEALAAYGPKARAAVPALIQLLGDRSSKEIVHAVPEALKAIDPVAAAAAGVK